MKSARQVLSESGIDVNQLEFKYSSKAGVVGTEKLKNLRDVSKYRRAY